MWYTKDGIRPARWENRQEKDRRRMPKGSTKDRGSKAQARGKRKQSGSKKESKKENEIEIEIEFEYEKEGEGTRSIRPAFLPERPRQGEVC